VDLLKACGVTVRESSLRLHEHWESVWLATKGPEKAFLQASIQLVAALHHIQRVTREARRHCYGRHYSDLSPTRCCSEALLCHRSPRWLQELETGAARPELAVPQIRLCG
jgi:hypothetical protein